MKQEITEEELALICGSLLGDANLHRRGLNSYRMTISHSIKAQPYVEWKFSRLKRLCSDIEGIRTETQTKKERQYQMVSFQLNSGLYLKPIHEWFYVPLLKNGALQYKKNGTLQYKKTITPFLLSNLPIHPLVLAVFMMDDGSVRSDAYSGRLATQGFSNKTKPRMSFFY